MLGYNCIPIAPLLQLQQRALTKYPGNEHCESGVQCVCVCVCCGGGRCRGSRGGWFPRFIPPELALSLQTSPINKTSSLAVSQVGNFLNVLLIPPQPSRPPFFHPNTFCAILLFLARLFLHYFFFFLRSEMCVVSGILANAFCVEVNVLCLCLHRVRSHYLYLLVALFRKIIVKCVTCVIYSYVPE